MRIIKNKYITELIFKQVDGGFVIPLTDEEQNAIDLAWKGFASMANRDAPEGKVFAVPKEVAEEMYEQISSDALKDIASRKVRLWEKETDPAKKGELINLAIITMAKSVALGIGPFGFFNLAVLLDTAGRNNDSIEILKQFLDEKKNYKYDNELLKETLEKMAKIATEKINKGGVMRLSITENELFLSLS